MTSSFNQLPTDHLELCNPEYDSPTSLVSTDWTGDNLLISLERLVVCSIQSLDLRFRICFFVLPWWVRQEKDNIKCCLYEEPVWEDEYSPVWKLGSVQCSAVVCLFCRQIILRQRIQISIFLGTRTGIQRLSNSWKTQGSTSWYHSIVTLSVRSVTFPSFHINKLYWWWIITINVANGKWSASIPMWTTVLGTYGWVIYVTEMLPCCRVDWGGWKTWFW